MKTIKQANGFDFVEILPDDFEENKKYPIVVHYHGHGSTKKKIEDFAENYSPIGAFERFSTEKGIVFILPLCGQESWFDCFSELKCFTLTLSGLPFVDKSHIYVSGASMGGCAAWQMLCSLNDVFAAGIICCGIPMYWDVRKRLKAPVWAFHGLDDTIIFAEETQKIAEIMNTRGGYVKTTLYEGVAHNCWDKTYGSEEIYDWLLTHQMEEKK